jgi:hypothetical protein
MDDLGFYLRGREIAGLGKVAIQPIQPTLLNR